MMMIVAPCWSLGYVQTARGNVKQKECSDSLPIYLSRALYNTRITNSLTLLVKNHSEIRIGQSDRRGNGEKSSYKKIFSSEPWYV
jgi:hypothetical protein